MKRRIKLDQEKRTKVVSDKKSLFIVLIALCVMLQIFFTIDVSATGAQISSLEEEYERLKKENRELEDKLVQASSLIELRQKANEMGFVRNSQTYYIEKDEAYALNLP